MYEIVKVPGGYKVRKDNGEQTSSGRKYFSNKPLTKKKAESQMRALYANENRVIKGSKRKQKMSPKRVTKPGSPKRVTKKLSPRRRKRTTSPIRKRA